MPIQKILLVDDSRTELLYIGEILRQAGYSVRTAENGQQALACLAEDKPDLVLMDVLMPGANGFQLTRTITRDPRWADLPVIICSGKGEAADRVWGLRQGARDHIVKPVDAAQLLAKIRALG